MTERRPDDGDTVDDSAQTAASVPAEGWATTELVVTTSRMPRWFKVLATVAAGLLVLLIALLLVGHGPGRHMQGGTATGAVQGVWTGDSERWEGRLCR